MTASLFEQETHSGFGLDDIGPGNSWLRYWKTWKRVVVLSSCVSMESNGNLFMFKYCFLGGALYESDRRSLEGFKSPWV